MIVADCKLFLYKGQSGEPGKLRAVRLGCEIHNDTRRLSPHGYRETSLSKPCPRRAVPQRGGAEEVARVRGAVRAGALPGEGGRAAVVQRRAHPCHLREVRPRASPTQGLGLAGSSAPVWEGWGAKVHLNMHSQLSGLFKLSVFFFYVFPRGWSCVVYGSKG